MAYADPNDPRRAATRDAWNAANPDLVKSYNRKSNAKRRREQPKKLARWARAWRRSRPDYKKTRRNTPTGKICESCGEDDKGRTWSDKTDLCLACSMRGYRNGFCEACRAALHKPRPTKDRGRPRKPTCWRCVPSSLTPHDASLVLDLWDLLWTREVVDSITAADLAHVRGISEDSAKRRFSKVVEFLQRFDPEARYETGDTTGASRILFAKAKVREGLARLVDEAAGRLASTGRQRTAS